MCRNVRLNWQAVAARAAVDLIDSRMMSTSQISYTGAETTKMDNEVVVLMVGRGTG